MGDEEKILNLIKEQVGSDNQKGWPVAVKDRVSYHCAKEGSLKPADVAVTFLWTMRDAVVPKLDKEKLAIATNFYTPSGINGMMRNILGNPCIRYIIMLGEEYASKDGSDTKTENTSANALRAFFDKGINEDRQIPGFEQSVYFDKHIPSEMIEKVRESVELIDLNTRFPDHTLQQKIEEANKIMKELEDKGPFMEEPKTFEYEEASESFPHEGGPIIVSSTTIPKTWIEIMHVIYKYGKLNLMNADTDRWVKEVNNLVAVIHDPQSMDLSLNPFLVPLTQDKIKAYQAEILSPKLPEGKAYTYGNKLRAYFYPAPDRIKELVTTKEYKDFEFGQGSHIDANVTYTEDYCEIDQLQDIVDVLKRDMYSKACIGMTWHVADELMRKHKSSPCLSQIQAMVVDDRLNLTIYFRSHDMAQGWPENAYGCAAIQKFIADGIGVEAGILTIISSSAQIYKHYYKQVEEMLKNNRKFEPEYNDPRGIFTVEVKGGKIIVNHHDPNNHKVIDMWDGTTARELREKISHSNMINTGHAMYLGEQIQKAEIALKKDLEFEQDKEIKI
ncbi:hypothetical protein GF345_04230 [Candidatus Woesearchaeota archaeon]|nr:hypothetical protein [Candidatus Woesearchaeota archaeon]